MPEKLVLREPDEKDEEAHAEFIKEMMSVDGKVIPSSAEIKEEDGSFKNWLSRVRKEAKGEVPDDRVPAMTLFLFRIGERKILGSVNIRHKLNDKLRRHSGHIGYGVAPSERRKGYASEMLSRALAICKEMKIKKALVTCDRDNIGSAKTIIKNGGVMECEAKYEDGSIRQRYWIDL